MDHATQKPRQLIQNKVCSMLSYTRGFSTMVPGSTTIRTHDQLEQLLAKGVLLHMILMGSTILGHEVLKGQHHPIQELVEYQRRSSSCGTSQPTDPDRPPGRTPLFNTPEPEARTREEVLVRNGVQ
jgi:hypothetical protein